MRTPKLMTPVIVVWEDAKVDGTVQHESVALAQSSYEPEIRRSIGFWLGWVSKDSHEAALIATDDDRNKSSGEAVGGISQIPRGMITDLISLSGDIRKK